MMASVKKLKHLIICLSHLISVIEYSIMTEIVSSHTELYRNNYDNSIVDKSETLC